MERRAELIRTGAWWCVGLAVISIAVAAAWPGSFALTRVEILSLGVLEVALLGAAAILPWKRLLGVRTGEMLLASVLLGLLGLMIATIGLSQPFQPTLAILLVLLLALSAVTADGRTHVTVGVTAAASWLVVATVRGPDDLGTVALWTIALVVVASIFWVLASSTRCAQAEADVARAEAVRSAALIAAAARSAESLASLDVETIFGSIVEAATDLGSDLAGIYVLEAGGEFEMRASAGLPDGPPSSDGDRPGVGGTVAATGATVRVDDYAASSFAIPGYVAMGLGSTVGVPVWSQGRLAGVLVAARRRVAPYTDDEMLVLELLSRHAGRALQLAHEANARVEIAERLREVDHREFELVTTVSHELRTPLAVISGLSETLATRWTDLSPEQLTVMLERLGANATALSSVLTKVLELAQLDGDDLASRHDRFDIGSLIATTTGRLGSLFDAHVLVVPEPIEVPVYGDVDLIARVLENLLKNAATHTPPGTRVEVDVRVHATSGTVTVEVSDDGPGVAQDALERLTERFYRAGPLMERPKGLGIGLALSAEILRRHGTSLQVTARNAEESGMRFAFDLRAVPPAETTTA